MSGGARPWGFRQVAGTEAQGPPPPPAPAGVPPSGVPVSLGKGHAPLTQSPHTQQTVPLRPPPPALPPASLSVLQIKVRVEVDHNSLVWFGSLNQPFTFFTWVIRMRITRRCKVPGAFNFYSIATFICNKNNI